VAHGAAPDLLVVVVLHLVAAVLLPHPAAAVLLALVAVAQALVTVAPARPVLLLTVAALLHLDPLSVLAKTARPLVTRMLSCRPDAPARRSAVVQRVKSRVVAQSRLADALFLLAPAPPLPVLAPSPPRVVL